ncbi:phosphotransferase [Paenibacillus sp. GCM10027629]|uniref:phosphotransferase n=1 Tax=Paenibacillus sp. GCM10027629 TaxID=3273414 RepID=UPI003631F224
MPFNHIISKYMPYASWQLVSGESGWNNTTRFVVTAEGTAVLRIYETHRDLGKIQFEHEVLLALAEQQLPCGVPHPLRTVDGHTYTMLADGTDRYACMFRYIDGARPSRKHPKTAQSIGVATGTLSRALACVQVSRATAYPPYYELEAAHPTCTEERISSFCLSPLEAFWHQSCELVLIYGEFTMFHANLTHLRKLPHQLVHGDINHSNLLVSKTDPEQVVAVLDFEFCTWDLRAIEPAVVLSGYLSESPDWPLVEDFIRGYDSIVSLTDEEIEAIPLLIRLRKLDIFIHFLGRYLDGIDSSEILSEHIRDVSNGLRTLRQEEEQILQIYRQVSNNRVVI